MLEQIPKTQHFFTLSFPSQRLRRIFTAKVVNTKYRVVSLVLISSREWNLCRGSVLFLGQKATIVLFFRDKFSIFIQEKKKSFSLVKLTIIFNYASFMWASHCFIVKNSEKHFLPSLYDFSKIKARKNFFIACNILNAFFVENKNQENEENYLWSENLWETIKRDKSELCT